VPNVEHIQRIEFQGPRYWPMAFELDSNDSSESGDMKESKSSISSRVRKRFAEILKDKFVLVKRHVGYLSYTDDLQGMRSILARPFPDTLCMANDENDFLMFLKNPSISKFATFMCQTQAEYSPKKRHRKHR